MSEKIRILIVNPIEIEGEGLLRLLSDGNFAEVRTYRDLRGMPNISEAQQPNSLVLIKCVQDKAAVEQCRSARKAWPAVRIAIMGGSCETTIVAEAFRAGVDGFFSSDASVACLIEMLKLVGLGEKLVPSRMVYELASGRAEPTWCNSELDLGDTKVSGRELEILRGLIEGEPNKIISRRLNITEATVKVHVKSILRKLHVMNRTQAAVWALSRGLGGGQGALGSAGTAAPRLADYDEAERRAEQ